jgi:hypothetical protein
LNYSPQATIDAGTCIYGRYGCTDPGATNYDQDATVDDGSCVELCSDPIISSVSVTGNVPTITLSSPEVNFTAQWYSPTTGETIETEDILIGPYLADGVYVLTITTSIGCVDVHVFGVNDTIYFGCIDPLATNFQPAANVPYIYYEGSGTVLSENCEYRIDQSKCIPKTLQTILDGIQRCISKKSNEFVNNMKAGRLTECNTNQLRILDLIYYLLQQRGLECVFNCQDSQTPEPFTISCKEKWEKGGPSGEGLIYDSGQTYVWGDLVQSPETGNIYVMIGEDPVTGNGPEEPGNTIRWKICNDTLPPSDVVNRLDPFLAKVKDICLDCGINIEQSVETESISLEDNETSINGSDVSINGDAVNLS